MNVNVYSQVLRVINIHDIVPKSPGFLLNESIPRAVMQYAEGLPWSYSHVGVELKLDHKVSPFLKQTNDPVCAHNLEALLHLLDGYVTFLTTLLLFLLPLTNFISYLFFKC